MVRSVLAGLLLLAQTGVIDRDPKVSDWAASAAGADIGARTVAVTNRLTLFGRSE